VEPRTWRKAFRQLAVNRTQVLKHGFGFTFLNLQADTPTSKVPGWGGVVGVVVSLVPLRCGYGWLAHQKEGFTLEVAVDVAYVCSLDENVTSRNSLRDFEGSLAGAQVVGDVNLDAIHNGDVDRDGHGC
jgi:hypothetical protein